MSDAAVSPVVPVVRRKQHRPLMVLFSAAWRQARTKAGAGIVVLLLAVALIGPFFAPKSPTDFAGIPFAHPSSSAALGTDYLGRDFVRAAEALGEKRWKILLGEVLPNITSPLMVEASLRLTFSVGVIAGLSFLGFGLQPPSADWGLMINENRGGLLQGSPWGVALPVAAIGLLTIGT